MRVRFVKIPLFHYVCALLKYLVHLSGVISSFTCVSNEKDINFVFFSGNEPNLQFIRIRLLRISC